MTAEEGIFPVGIEKSKETAPGGLDELRKAAYSFLKPRRIRHVQGCEEVAVELAKLYGCDVRKAATAAILHDITKKLDYDEQLLLCSKYDIICDDDELKNEKLLHAKTGAYLARDLFGTDDDVFNAILWHTTGKPDMSLLEKIIYLADYIEPTRDFPGVEELRKLVYSDIDAGMAQALKMSYEHVSGEGIRPHRNTADAYSFYSEVLKKGEKLMSQENENKKLTPVQIAAIAAKALDDKKARDIKVLDTSGQTVLADYFVICNGTSSTHVKALVDEVDRQLSEAGEPPVRREGLRSDIWVLMDFGCVIVHIFTDEARKFYNLERLWSDSKEVDLSSLLSP